MDAETHYVCLENDPEIEFLVLLNSSGFRSFHVSLFLALMFKMIPYSASFILVEKWDLCFNTRKIKGALFGSVT